MKNYTKRVKRFGIFPFSQMRFDLGRRDFYAPSQWPLQDTKEAAATFAMKNIKQEELKEGQKAFKVRPVWTRA